MNDKVTWQSSSGQVYEFGVYAHSNTRWYAVPGIYMFASQERGSWRVYYVGQTDSFKDRIPCHEQWTLAVREGATAVLACRVPAQTMRNSLERELCEEYQPVLNQRLRRGLDLQRSRGLPCGPGLGLPSDRDLPNGAAIGLLGNRGLPSDRDAGLLSEWFRSW